MLIHRDRGVRIIRINVPVRVNAMQITARYSHSSHKTKPNLILSVILTLLIHVNL